jgi:hypothetical protein
VCEKAKTFAPQPESRREEKEETRVTGFLQIHAPTDLKTFQ